MVLLIRVISTRKPRNQPCFRRRRLEYIFVCLNVKPDIVINKIVLGIMLGTLRFTSSYEGVRRNISSDVDYDKLGLYIIIRQL